MQSYGFDIFLWPGTDESWLLLNYAAITEAKKTEETSLPLNREIGSERNNGSKKQSTPPSVSESYTRSDLCEIEPSIVSSIFRILVNYVRNIEQVDVKALTKAQKDCYVVTLEVIHVDDIRMHHLLTVHSMLFHVLESSFRAFPKCCGNSNSMFLL